MQVKIIASLCMFFLCVMQVSAQSFDIIKTTPQKDQFHKADSIFNSDYKQKDSVTAFTALAQLNRLAIQLQDKRLELAVYDLKGDWYAANYHYNPRSLFYYGKTIDMARLYGLSHEVGYYTFKIAYYYHG